MADLLDTDGLGGVTVHLADEDRNTLVLALKPTMRSSRASDDLFRLVMGTGPACRTCRVAGLAVAVEHDHCSECAGHLERPGRQTTCEACTARELDEDPDA